MKIMIDPGHYGYDSGAVGPAGTYERDVTMPVAQRIGKLLQQTGQDVRMTRQPGQLKVVSNLDDDLYTRVVAANQWQADFLVSIHCNSFSDSSAHGMEVITMPGQGPSDQLAEAVIDAMVAEFPELRLRTDMSDGDRDKESSFYVLRKTSMPAILVEMAFISNPKEERLLISEAGQERFAQAIAKGILNHIGVEGKPMAEQWKKDLMNELVSADLVNDYHEPEDLPPKWWVAALVLNAMKVLREENK